MRIINNRRNTRVYLMGVNKVNNKLVNKMAYKFDFLAINDSLGRISFSIYAKGRNMRTIKARAKSLADNFALNSSYFDWKA
jgi:hypothetical protein